jgi:drug/metabolite transporter (DMT)-like permease
MKPNRAAFIASFVTVSLAWGASYFAIRIGLRVMPPFLMGGVRYLIAAGILWAWCEFRGVDRPTAREWSASAVLGFLFVVCGNGTVLWAEQRVPSGAAALLVSVSPVWTVLIEWTIRQRSRPKFGTWLGLALGLAGVSTLVLAGGPSGAIPAWPALVIVLGTLGWGGGSVLAVRLSRPASALRSLSAQLLCGGLVLTLMGFGSGESSRWVWSAFDLSSVLALTYLILVATLAAYIAYAWLMHNVSPTTAGSCAYVNPMVAVALGAVFGEPFGIREVIAMAAILAGVGLVARAELRQRSAQAVALTQSVNFAKAQASAA